MSHTTDDITLYQPRLDYRAIPPLVLRTARVMKYTLWINSPAVGLDPENPRRPADLPAIANDVDALLRIAAGPTQLMATWKARTLFLRAIERLIAAADRDIETRRAVAQQRDHAVADWLNAAATMQETVFLHALLFRNASRLSEANETLFRERVFDPLVAMTVVRRTATWLLPIASGRQRGPIARARRTLTADWTRLHHGVDIDDRSAQRALLRRAAHGHYAGDEFLLAELNRQSCDIGVGDTDSAHELQAWVHCLPPRAFRQLPPCPRGIE